MFRFISKTVQDTAIVEDNGNSYCDLSNGPISNDLQWALNLDFHATILWTSNNSNMVQD